MPTTPAKMASRRVCNMTPEELSKKREIDRDNQRYFRNKRKNHIQTLEKEVSELRKELEEARELLKQASVCSVCGSSNVPTASCEAQLATPPSNIPGIDPAQKSDHFFWDGRQAALPINLGPGFTVNLLEEGSASQCLDLSFGDFVSTLDLPISVEPSSIAESSPPRSANGRQPWQMPPMHVAPTTRLEHTIEHISTMGRKYLQKRAYPDELDEPGFPSISSLLNPSLESDSSKPLSSAVAAHVWTSPVDSMPERIAFMYVLSHLLRWLICQDEKTYNQLPEFIKPTQLQCTVPHPAWIDTVAWPEMRDVIIMKMDWMQFEKYRSLSARSLSVNWKYTDSGAFLESPDGQNLVLNPLFEDHICKLGNWSIGPEVGEAFPMLASWCAKV